MGSQETLECRPPKKSKWDSFSDFCTQNPIGQFLSNFLSGITLLMACHLFGYWNCFGLSGRYIQERKRRQELKDEYEKELNELYEKLQHIERANAEHTNSLLSEMKSLSKGFTQCASIVSNLAPSNTGPRTCVIQNETANPGGPPPEAAVKVLIPVSERSDEAERIVEKKIGPNIESFKGSRILQSKVVLYDDILDKLHGLADACTELDNRVTVQLSDLRVFIRTDEGLKMKMLDSTHQVPIILHSAYAAGKLTIEGLNLENATIKAATFDKCITLENVKGTQVLNGLEVRTWIVQLPSSNLEEVAVYAMKTILMEDQEVSVCSSVVKIQDNNLRAVVRIGIPSVILMIYIGMQLYHDGIQMIKWSNLGPDLAWTAPFLVIIFSQLLPPSTENMIRASLERVRLMILALYFSTWSFLFKQYPGRKREHKKKSLDGEPKDLNDDATYNFEAGEERLNETNHMAMGGLLSLTETIAQLDKTLSEIKCGMLEEEKDMDCSQGTIQGTNMDTSVEDNPELAINRDWQWHAYQEYKTKSGRVKLRKYGDGIKEKNPVKVIPFDVVYGMKEKLWAKRDYINIFSPLLIEIIVLLIPDYIYEVSKGYLEVYAAALFHIHEKLREIRLKGVDEVLPGNAPSSEEDREKQQLHLDHLLRFMDKEFEDILKKYSVMESGHHVSWDMLWAFFPTDTQVVYHCGITDEELVGIVTRATYEVDPQQGPFFSIKIKMWDYNCSTWNTYMTRRSIHQFDGECRFTSLQAFPLRFENDPKKAEKDFLTRGESFCYLSMQVRNRFMNYKGLIYMMKSVNGCLMLSKEAASGRVMVDLGSFAKMNPSYKMGSAEPPCEVLRDNKVVTKDIKSSPDRMYAPAMVYGFSFRLKEWGTFQVCGFNEIVFNESAFEALVMPEQRKELLYKLVREYIPKKNMVTTGAGTEQVEQFQHVDVEQVDPIVSKGEGCIILCYGLPGTGKTLTAESISEALHAPLWSLSISELGTTPQALESYLVKVLDVASTWGAILLLDEADVYLEKRSSFDLTRTAMTGIFLRNLEYYRGVLFLTTNRIVTFDEAFRSRISMILYYEMKTADRRKIWETILNRVNMKDIPNHLLAQFSEKELNGRDIRNVVHRAMILAKSNGDRLTGNYILQSLNDVVESLDVLTSKCKGEDLMSLGLQ